MRRMKNTFSAAPNQSEQWLPVGDQLPVRKDSDWLEQETFEQISSDAPSPNIGAFAEPTIRRRLKIKTEIYSAPTVDWFGMLRDRWRIPGHREFWHQLVVLWCLPYRSVEWSEYFQLERGL